MTALTLKDLPEELHAKLKQDAAAHGRSLNREIIHRLKLSTLQRGGMDTREVLAEARRVRGLFQRPLQARDLSRWKRAGRP
jgi:plasmid stability protein